MMTTAVALWLAWLLAVAQAVFVVLVIGGIAWLGGLRGSGLVGVLVLAAGAGGLTAWLSSRRVRRRRRAQRSATPPEHRRVLAEEVGFYAALDPERQRRFERLVRVFLSEVPIVAVGCEFDERIRVLIASGAVIPIFGFPRWEYATLQRILVYPDDFQNPIKHPDQPDDPGRRALGMVTEAEGLLDGLVMLSLPDIEHGFEDGGDKHNVVIHEFAHLVDRGNGRIDGIPAGLRAEDRSEWERLVAEAFHDQLRNRDIPRYGFTNDQEFFAVCSEYFFECPEELHRRHTELYRMLVRIYRQDPGDCLGQVRS